MMWQLFERGKKLLSRPRAAWFGVLLGVLLASPSLANGLVLDDHLHLLRTRTEGLGALHDLYDFWSGRTEDMRTLVDRGALPWFTYDHLKIRFWRPLSALTHVLDGTLWPDRPALMHAQSLLWYAAFLFAAAWLYRRVAAREETTAGAPWVAALATLLLAVDDGHGVPVGWVANRNALVAGMFGILAVALHDRHRRDGWRPAAILAPLSLGAALLSGEIALGAVAYLIAHAVVLDRASLRSRALGLAPYAFVVAVWRVAYVRMGFGVFGSGIYVDPGSSPGSFLSTLAPRIAKLMLGAVSAPPSEIWILGGSDARAVRICLLVLSAIVWGALPVLRASAAARFWAIGAALAIVPAATSEPLDRLLVFVGIGAMGVVAAVVHAAAERVDAGQSFGTRILAVSWLFVHGIVAPALFVFTVTMPGTLNHLIVLAREGLVEPPAIASRTLVLLNSNNILGPIVVNGRSPSAILAMWRPLTSPDAPLYTRTLAIGDRKATVTRTSDRVIRVGLEGGMLSEASSRLLRDDDHPLFLGASAQMTGLTVTVTSMLRAGIPDEIECRFDRSLDDPTFWWVSWNGARFETVTIPAVGQRATYNAR